MIPALVHRIWFGTAPIPSEYEAWWQAWQRQLPSHEFVTWTDRNIDALPAVAAKIGEAQGMARKGDVARYEIIRRNGGMYLDCDVMPLNFYDPREEARELVVCNENVDASMCSIGFFAASEGCETLERAVRTINGKRLNQAPPNMETGPWFFGSMLNATNPLAYRKLPTDSFYPYHYEEPFSHILTKDLGATYGIHVWGGSWLPDERHLEMATRFLDRGDVHEAEHTLNKLRSRERTASIVTSIKDIRSARDLIRSACLSGVLSRRLSTTEFGCFDLFKTCKYLLEFQSDALFWSIGSGDGVTRDELRPIMVNYDPKSVFLEPAPDLFRKLKENYGRNRNILFIRGVFGPHAAASEHSPADDARTPPGPAVAPVIDLDSLLAASGGRAPDVLSISSQATDAAIIERILSGSARPRIIHYSRHLLTEEERSRLHDLMKTAYVRVEKEGMVTAYRQDFLLSYCSHIFVEHGIQSIFKNALSSIFGR